MAKILVKNNLAPAVYEFIIDAPMIAHKCQPGQFVMIRTDENSERIPLTIADFDREKGTITLIVQTVGNTTTHLCETFNVGDDILDVLGPLGMPSHMQKFGTVVCIGGGIGVAPVYPIARAYHELGNKVISIIGARNEELIIFKDKMAAVSDELIITTDDGSAGHKGFVTDPLKAMLEAGEQIDPGLGHRTCYYDEKCCRDYQALWHAYYGQPEYHHGRRYWYVRRLPCKGRGRKQICLRGRS